MKRRVAFAEEEDEHTGEAIPGTALSASFFSLPEESILRRKRSRQSADSSARGCSSISLGPALDYLRNAIIPHRSFLTLIAGENDDNEDVWKEVSGAGTKIRLFFVKDEIINAENKTYIDREILISKSFGDDHITAPDFKIGQRTMRGLQAHHLFIDGPIVPQKEYIFSKLGDEIPGIGLPDLHCTFRPVQDWESINNSAKFVNFDGATNADPRSVDRNETIYITDGDIQDRKVITYDVEHGEAVDSDRKPKLGVVISCADFKGLWSVREKEATSAYMSPPTKRRREDESFKTKTITLKLIGMGPEIEEGGSRADLNLNLVLR